MRNEATKRYEFHGYAAYPTLVFQHTSNVNHMLLLNFLLRSPLVAVRRRQNLARGKEQQG